MVVMGFYTINGIGGCEVVGDSSGGRDDGRL